VALQTMFDIVIRQTYHGFLSVVNACLAVIQKNFSVVVVSYKDEEIKSIDSLNTAKIVGQTN
jgi:hypothetical protein